MTGSITMTPDVFSTKGIAEVAGFSAMVAACLVRRATLQAELDGPEIRLSLLPGTAQSGLTLEGRWRRPFQGPAGSTPTGARLVLPLMFRANRMLLSWQRITVLGRNYRPTADFLARNLFAALLVNAPVTFAETVPGLQAGPANQGLINHYYYITRGHFAEPLFHQTPTPEAMDLLVASSFLPIAELEDPLLRHGFVHLRRHRHPTDEKAELKSAFLEARRAMLAHYPN